MIRETFKILRIFIQSLEGQINYNLIFNVNTNKDSASNWIICRIKKNVNEPFTSICF